MLVQLGARIACRNFRLLDSPMIVIEMDGTRVISTFEFGSGLSLYEVAIPISVTDPRRLILFTHK